MSIKNVVLYTDGACSGNPGPGGYGLVLIYNGHTKEYSEGFENTTNNQMELSAIISGLKFLKERCNVEIFSDSKYVIDAINKHWLENWQKNNWKTAGKQPVKNVELWKELIVLLEMHNVKFNWVKGHAGNDYNEICDKLAVAAYQKFLK